MSLRGCTSPGHACKILPVPAALPLANATNRYVILLRCESSKLAITNPQANFKLYFYVKQRLPHSSRLIIKCVWMTLNIPWRALSIINETKLHTLLIQFITLRPQALVVFSQSPFFESPWSFLLFFSSLPAFTLAAAPIAALNPCWMAHFPTGTAISTASTPSCDTGTTSSISSQVRSTPRLF